MNRIRNNEWQNEEELQSSIKHYVMQNMKRSEVLDFLKRDYPEYAWSLPKLDRHLRYFDIKYINYETTPGQLLGYRVFHKKLCEQHGLQFLMVFFQLNVINLRGLVYDDNGMSRGVGTSEECWKKEKKERPS